MQNSLNLVAFGSESLIDEAREQNIRRSSS